MYTDLVGVYYIILTQVCQLVASKYIILLLPLLVDYCCKMLLPPFAFLCYYINWILINKQVEDKRHFYRAALPKRFSELI